jgi:hypothetical protein
MRPSTGQSCAADSKLLTSALRYVSHPRPPTNLTYDDHADNPSDDHHYANSGQNHGHPAPALRTNASGDDLSLARTLPEQQHPRTLFRPAP